MVNIMMTKINRTTRMIHNLTHNNINVFKKRLFKMDTTILDLGYGDLILGIDREDKVFVLDIYYYKIREIGAKELAITLYQNGFDYDEELLLDITINNPELLF